MTDARMCYDYPLRNGPITFTAQVVLPRDLTAFEAERLCAFIKTLALDKPLPQQESPK